MPSKRKPGEHLAAYQTEGMTFWTKQPCIQLKTLQHAQTIAQEDEGTPVQLLDVLEAFEMQTQHARQRSDLHDLFRVLQALALVAEELVVRIQRLCCAAS